MSRDAITPRTMLDRTSDDYARLTVEHLRLCWQTLDADFDTVERTIAEIRECQAWERYPPGRPYSSLEGLLAGLLGLNFEQVRKAVRQARKRYEQTQKAAQNNPDPLPNQGRPGVVKKGDKKEKCPLLSSSRGNQASHRIRRLRRDHPAVAARLDAGEFKSVRAAERAARGEDPNPPRRVAPPLEKIRRLWAALSADDRAAFLREASQRE